MKVHRLARIPPAGPTRSGKRLSLCGNYLHLDHLTTDEAEVTCQVCIRSATSERTQERGRIACNMEEYL